MPACSFAGLAGVSLLHHGRNKELQGRKVRLGGGALLNPPCEHIPDTGSTYTGVCKGAGHSLMWCGAVFAWRAKLKPCVALSSRDAEAIAAVFAERPIIKYLILFSELDFTQQPPLDLHVDNKATVDGAHMSRVHKDPRHRAMRPYTGVCKGAGIDCVMVVKQGPT